MTEKLSFVEPSDTFQLLTATETLLLLAALVRSSLRSSPFIPDGGEEPYGDHESY